MSPDAVREKQEPPSVVDMELSDSFQQSAKDRNESFDTPQDKKLLQKIDMNLLPILTLLYLMSFLDRTNIGNAKLDGLATDLHISGSTYNTSLAVYFIAYVIFEIPANIILKRLNPRIWLPTITLLWGIASIGQGLVTNEGGLFGIRVLLGITEAGLFPGVMYVFSVYYRRKERPWRVAFFFGGAAMAGAFGGILAYAIGKMDNVGGHKGWQWIFIIEGCMTVLASLIGYLFVPTWADEAKFLDSQERERLQARLLADSDAGKREPFDWHHVRQALRDHLVWAYAFLFHGFSYVLYTLSLFLPTIISGMGFVTWKAQLMSVPPYAFATICIWIVLYFSARANMRGPFIIGAGAIAIIGYIILLTTKTPGSQYVGVFFATSGVYVANSLLLSWPGENVSGQTKRAVALAMQITIGDIGAVVGMFVYRPSLASHHYRIPHIVSIIYVLLGMASAAYLWVWMAKENRRRDRVVLEQESGRQKSEVYDEEEEVNRLGQDRSLNWRYQL